MIAIYRELEKLGEHPLMASHGGTFEFELDREGVPCERVGPPMSEDLCRRYIEAGMRGPEGVLKEHEIRDHVLSEMDFFREKNATAVVTGFMITTALSARGAGIPLAVDHLGSFIPPIFDRKLFACGEHFDGPLMRLIPESWINRGVGWHESGLYGWRNG